MTEILGLPLEARDFIQAVGIGQQFTERGHVGSRQMLLGDADQARLFRRQRPPNDILQAGVARRDNTLLGETL